MARRTRSTCSVENCERTSIARQLCDRHYAQVKRSPDWENRPPRATQYQWLLGFVSQSGWSEAECVIWPFSFDAHGYPLLAVGYKRTHAHRVTCELVHGPPPAGRYEAAHSCGVSSCFNPSHLRWATPSENNADKVNHGTNSRGLAAEDVRRIRREVAVGGHGTQRRLARELNVSESAISAVVHGRTWAALDSEAAA